MKNKFTILAASLLLLCACQQPVTTTPATTTPSATVSGTLLNSQNVLVQELADLAPGENADALLYLTVTPDLLTSLPDGTSKEQLKKFKGFLLIMKVNIDNPLQPIVWAGAAFSDKDTATAALSRLNNFFNGLPELKANTTLSQQDALLIATNDQNNSLTGHILKQPAIQSLLAEKQPPFLFGFLDSGRLPEFNVILKALPLPFEKNGTGDLTADSQRISDLFATTLQLSKTMQVRGSLDGSELIFEFSNTVLTNKIDVQHLLLSYLPQTPDKPATAENYPETDQQATDLLQTWTRLTDTDLTLIQGYFSTLNQSNSEVKIIFNLTGNQLQSIIRFNPVNLDAIVKNNLSRLLDWQSDQLNTVKKNDMSSAIVAMEQYYNANDKYPGTSGCLENILEAQSYFTDEMVPLDPAGAQTFGDSSCSSGYYYQDIDKTQFNLWTRLAGENRGNAAWPDAKAGSGNYYVINMQRQENANPYLENATETGNPLPPSNTAPKPKVKRPTT